MHINHTEVPRITNNIQSVQEHFTVKGALNFTCEFRGFPHPRIAFYLNGQPISNGHDFSIVNNTLTIPLPQVSQSGIYQCIVSNEFGDDQAAWLLEIRQPSEFLMCFAVSYIFENLFLTVFPQVQPYNLTALDAFNDPDLGALIVKDSGSNLTISVDVVADPCPDIVWSYNGTRLGPSNETFTYNNVCAEAGASSPIWTFTLSVLITTDTSGSYTASFTNFLGSNQSPKAYFTIPGMKL